MRLKLVKLDDAAPWNFKYYHPYLKGFSIQIWKFILLIWLED